MKDIPIFTTEFGVASLELSQIPPWGKGYIAVQSSVSVKKLIEECASFCKCAGAKEIYATGNEELHQFPLHAKTVLMVRKKAHIENDNVCLTAVNDENWEFFRNIYNDKMKNVTGAKFLQSGDKSKILPNAFFYVDGGEYAGIGIVNKNEISAVASLKSGMGEKIVNALSDYIMGDEVVLEVSSDNKKAISLYNRLGFREIATKRVWYKIL